MTLQLLNQGICRNLNQMFTDRCRSSLWTFHDHHCARFQNAGSSQTKIFASRFQLFSSTKDNIHGGHYHHSKSKKSLSVAIVGSGPSGFYSAKYLQLALQRALKTEGSIIRIKELNVDLIERLPTPFGLVRSGVAPDHPEVKNVENDFVSLIEKATKSAISSEGDNTTTTNDDDDPVLNTSVEFRGNVKVGKDVSLQELRDLYDVVILAYGCESDKKLGIEIENYEYSGDESKTLRGIYSAREFVAWYNGHPDYAHMGGTFQKLLGNGHPENAQVVVIGQGNVALDCARILAKGRENLIDTDIASHSLPVLGGGIKHTTIIGRRGHIQGAFTIKELRELAKLEKEGCDTYFHVIEDELDAGATHASLEELKQSRPKTRIDKLLRDVAVPCSKTVETTSSKTVTIRFMLNPVKFIPDINDGTKLGSVLCEQCKLVGDPFQQVAVGTGKMEEIPANMALVSIGYKGIPLPGMDSSMFDEKRGVVRNVNGRVEASENGGLYVSGWLKRGPSGIIGTNITDAKDTIASIMADIEHEYIHVEESPRHKGRSGLDKLLSDRQVEFVDWSKYEIINSAEKDPERLRSPKQPREKICSVKEMLSLV